MSLREHRCASPLANRAARLYFLITLMPTLLYLVGCSPTVDSESGRGAFAADDPCEVFARYSDGICDLDCATPDPDCDEVSPIDRSGTDETSSETVSEEDDAQDNSTEGDTPSKDDRTEASPDDESAATIGGTTAIDPPGRTGDDDDTNTDESDVDNNDGATSSNDEATTSDDDDSSDVNESDDGESDQNFDNPGEPPNAWTCWDSLWLDGWCDCGCGAPDPECGGSSGTIWCDNSGCEEGYEVDVDQNHLCVESDDDEEDDGSGDEHTQIFDVPGEPPPGWTCHETYWIDGYCDCGCGVPDPDCGGSSSVDACYYIECDPGYEVIDGQTHLCVEILVDSGPDEPPAEWTCSDGRWDDTWCDCGCGVPDPDCGGSSSIDVCDEYNCGPSAVVVEDQNHLCVDDDNADDTDISDAPVDGWGCLAVSWLDSVCDCGCGVFDPDCGISTADMCDVSHCGDGFEVSEDYNFLCVPDDFDEGDDDAPAEWTCTDTYWIDGDCDCGCGVPDPDCDGLSSRDVCDYEFCLSPLVVAEDQNHLCVEADDDTEDDDDPPVAPPEGWGCWDAGWQDSVCDCGCDIPDADCEGESAADACETVNCSVGDEVVDGQNHLCVPIDDVE